MESHYYKEYSNALNRDMEFEIIGHDGKLCYAFAPMNGRFWDFKDNGMVEVAKHWVDEGKIRFVLVDSIDQESWTNYEADGRYRSEMQEKWYHYVVDELVPRCKEITGNDDKAMTTGCSMGAMHAAIFFFRRPDLFDTVVGMSGTYNGDIFYKDYHDDLVYNNSPTQFLANMPDDHYYMDLYRQSTMIFCIGQGAWEFEVMPGHRQLDEVCHAKGIPAWFDYWGYDIAHDWPYWKMQFPYFLGKIFG